MTASVPDSLIEVAAPAKVILTGEHAVLFGCPAVAAAINLCATTTITACRGSGLKQMSKKILSIRLEDMKASVSGTAAMFSRVKSRLFSSYKKFVTGKRALTDLLLRPSELFEFAAGSIIEACRLELERSVDISLSSQIPIGCGMGSSAATIVSFIKAFTQYFGVDKSIEWLERLVREIERLQHGRSSGLDTAISLHGGALIYAMGAPPKALDGGALQFLQEAPFWIINTGRPESSTGEAVEAVRKGIYGKESHPIWADFQAVSLEMQRAVERQDRPSLEAAISENQRLLDRLGVVPQKVQSFVAEASQVGACIKITGSGAVIGEPGGVLLGVGPSPSKALCDAYGYPMAVPVRLASRGAQTIRG